MQNAYPEGGGMSAVLGLDGDTVAKVCDAVAGELSKPVSVANYNCPGQIVITGDIGAVQAAGEKLSAQGAKRVVPLKVSGPFHSALLEKASQQLSQALLEVEIRDIRIPYLTNVTGDYVRDKGEVRDLLSRQVCSPVRWQQSVERMIADGIDTFVEIGPGKTLSGFMKRINKDVRVINIDKCDDIEKLKEL